MLVDDEAELTELVLSDPAWTPVAEPIYLVCTHGKHDPCCALRGRPVAYALAEALAPGRVWECSHVGGDRFAGNMVSLPSGLYLGRVEPEEVSAVAELIDAGRVPVHYLRGRSSLSTPAQAAQHFAHTGRWSQRVTTTSMTCCPQPHHRRARKTPRLPGPIVLLSPAGAGERDGAPDACPRPPLSSPATPPSPSPTRSSSSSTWARPGLRGV